MTTRPFDVVAHRASDGNWYAWPWEFAFYIGNGDSQGAAVSSAMAALDKELDRRKATLAQYKFKPKQWPAPLQLIRERVSRDEERRSLPTSVKSYSDWLGANPIQNFDRSLPANTTDNDIVEFLQRWGTLICDGRIDDAFSLIVDATSILPMSDFPRPHVPMQADELLTMLADACVETPVGRVDVAGPTVTRIERPASAIDQGQRLVCGVGRVVFVASYVFALHATGMILETEVHGFATDRGTLPAFVRLDLKSAEDV